MEEFEIYEFNSISGKTFSPDLQKRINYCFSRILSWYPDKVVVYLNRDHKKFTENTFLRARREAGYNDNKEFCEDFGFTFVNKNLERQQAISDTANIVSLLKSDSVLSKYYFNSFYPNSLLTDETLFGSAFEADFNKRKKELNLTVSLDDVYKVVSSDIVKDLNSTICKPKKIYLVRSQTGSKFWTSYEKLESADFSNIVISTPTKIDLVEAKEEIEKVVEEKVENKEEPVKLVEEAPVVDAAPVEEKPSPVEVKEDKKEPKKTSKKTTVNDDAKKENDLKEEKYQKALKLFNERKTILELKKALKLFTELGNYSDSSILLEDCEDLINASDKEKMDKVSALAKEAIEIINSNVEDITNDLERIKKEIGKIDKRNRYVDVLAICGEMCTTLPIEYSIHAKIHFTPKSNGDELQESLILHSLIRNYANTVLKNLESWFILTSQLYKDMAFKRVEKVKQLHQEIIQSGIFTSENKLYEGLINKATVFFKECYKDYISKKYSVSWVIKVKNLAEGIEAVYKAYPINEDSEYLILDLLLTIVKESKDHLFGDSLLVYKERYESKYQKIKQKKELERKKKLEEEKRRQEEIKRKKEAEAKKRYDDYWNAHLELKNSLENEKEELLEEINVYQKRLKNMKEKTLLDRLVEDKERREKEISSLNFFQGKKKKLLQSEIAELEVQIASAKEDVAKKKKECNDKLNEYQNRIIAIDLELTKPR